MYTTKVKPRYRTKGAESHWNVSIGPEDYVVLLTMEDMSLLCNPDTQLLIDVYNNKLEEFDMTTTDGLLVKAKNDDYAQRFALNGTYEITGFKRESGPTKLVLRNTDDHNDVKLVFPSRLKLVSDLED